VERISRSETRKRSIFLGLIKKEHANSVRFGLRLSLVKRLEVTRSD